MNDDKLKTVCARCGKAFTKYYGSIDRLTDNGCIDEYTVCDFELCEQCGNDLMRFAFRKSKLAEGANNE